jgi:hypothetical protein
LFLLLLKRPTVACAAARKKDASLLSRESAGRVVSGHMTGQRCDQPIPQPWPLFVREFGEQQLQLD